MIKLFKPWTWFSSDERKRETDIPNPIEEVCYKSMYYNGKYITIVYPDGDVTMSECTEDQYKDIIGYGSSKNYIDDILARKEKEEKITKDDLRVLRDHTDFEIDGTTVRMKDLSVPIPDAVVGSFIEILERIELSTSPDDTVKLIEYYNTLVLFWHKLAANPIAESRESLLRFVEHNNIRLTRSGNLVAFRRIVSQGEEDKNMVEYISKKWLKVKNMGRNPKNYFVFERDGEYSFSEWSKGRLYNELGNLDQLYKELPERTENRYTDKHTLSYDIRIGQLYKIRDEDIELRRYGSCGGLLHICDGVNFNYEGYGDTPVVVIIDPMKAARMDTGCTGKIGVTEMFIVAATEYTHESGYVDIPEDTLVEMDTVYNDMTLKELASMVQTHDMTPICLPDDVVPVTTLADISTIYRILQERTQKIY